MEQKSEREAEEEEEGTRRRKKKKKRNLYLLLNHNHRLRRIQLSRRKLLIHFSFDGREEREEIKAKTRVSADCRGVDEGPETFSEGDELVVRKGGGLN